MRQHIKDDRIVLLNTHFLFNPDLKNDAYMIPGIVVMLLTIIMSLMGALTLVKEKEIGTLEHIMVTPIKKSYLIAGKLLPYLIYAFIEMAIVIKLAQIIFSISFAGSYWTLYFIAVLFLFTTIGIGLIVSTLSQTQQQALFLSWFFTVFSSIICYLVLEFVLDYWVKTDFRSTWILWPYLIVFYTGLMAMIGYSFLVGRTFGFITLITYFISGGAIWWGHGR